MQRKISIKELHATTGEHVPRASRSSTPMVVTDRGEPVAVLAGIGQIPVRRRKRRLLAGYADFMAQAPRGDVLADLDNLRGDR